MNFKYKKVGFDIVFNMMATAFPTVVLQLLIYPWLAQRLSNERYGIMLTILSVMQLIYGTLGSSLNNVRLLRDSEYEKKHLNGDFNIFVIRSCVIAIVSITIFSAFYMRNEPAIERVIVTISTTLFLLFTYLEVSFRLILNFKKILFVNILMTIGYCSGYGLFLITRVWSFVYLMAALLPFVYTFVSSGLLKEPYCKTKLFAATSKDLCNLNLSGFCSRFLIYADKMILFPLLGGGQVAVYHAANFIGRILLMATKPINSVILSYLAKSKNQNSKRSYKYLAILLVMCFIGYGICMLLSEMVIKWRYPQYVEAAMNLVPITTLSLCIMTYANFITPLTLKFCKMVWQVVINFITIITYVVSILILYKQFGLSGFCWGVTIGYFIKLLLLIIIYISPQTKSIYKKEDRSL